MGNSQKSYKDGSVYRGEFATGKKRHGKGRMKYRSGYVFEGEWENDYPVKGTLTLRRQTYVGEVTGGFGSKFPLRHGNGKFDLGNGTLISGRWVNGMALSGSCEYPKRKIVTKYGTFDYGCEYSGNFLNKKGALLACRHGQGTFTFLNGTILEGIYRTDSEKNVETVKATRFLIKQFKDRTKDGEYVGEVMAFPGGDAVVYLQHGTGTMKYEDGRICTGTFQEGQFKKGTTKKGRPFKSEIAGKGKPKKKLPPPPKRKLPQKLPPRQKPNQLRKVSKSRSNEGEVDEFASMEEDLKNDTFDFEFVSGENSNNRETYKILRSRICPRCEHSNMRNDASCKHTMCEKCSRWFCHVCLRVPSGNGFGAYENVIWNCGSGTENAWSKCDPNNSISFVFPIQSDKNKNFWFVGDAIME